MKTWQGRIETPADRRFEHFTSSIEQDQRLAPYDVVASRAHARALADAAETSESPHLSTPAETLPPARERVSRKRSPALG